MDGTALTLNPMELARDNIDPTSLTKADLGAMLFDQLGLNKREAGDLVDAFFEIIMERLAAGEEVKLADFAGFQVRKKAPRPGRNPRTDHIEYHNPVFLQSLLPVRNLLY